MEHRLEKEETRPQGKGEAKWIRMNETRFVHASFGRGLTDKEHERTSILSLSFQPTTWTRAQLSGMKNETTVAWKH